MKYFFILLFSIMQLFNSMATTPNMNYCCLMQKSVVKKSIINTFDINSNLQLAEDDDDNENEAVVNLFTIFNFQNTNIPFLLNSQLIKKSNQCSTSNDYYVLDKLSLFQRYLI